MFKALCFTIILSYQANAWQKAENPIWSLWGEQIKASNVLQEYPSPQMICDAWLNLNGIWQVQQGFAEDKLPVSAQLQGTILVPFLAEAALPGVKKRWKRI